MEIYLDNAATTKPEKEVVNAMMKALNEMYGNPSSLHSKGLEVEKEIKKIRRLLARALGCDEKEIIFTSGGTESNNLAIRGLIERNKRQGNHIITSKIEHKSILNLYQKLEKEGYKTTYLDVDEGGFISLEQLKEVISEDTILVSIIHVNNEVGSIQDIKEISKIVKGYNPQISIHVDGVQSFGKIKYHVKDLNIDTLAISGHKVNGPKGIGALYINKNIKINPLLIGGGQEGSLRGGTENVPGIFGLGEATRLLIENQDIYIEKIYNLKKYLMDLLEKEIKGIQINNKLNDNYAPHIVSILLPGIKSEIMLHSLASDGIYVSSGSACSSKDRKLNHVLQAMGIKDEYIDSAIRISLNHRNTMEEIDYFVKKLKEHYITLKRIIRR
ncbi:MAG: cysteine desulfurase [Clostridiales bacterium]|nr:cysteine desulfurase [Clostridiales bacterium]